MLQTTSVSIANARITSVQSRNYQGLLARNDPFSFNAEIGPATVRERHNKSHVANLEARTPSAMMMMLGPRKAFRVAPKRPCPMARFYQSTSGSFLVSPEAD